MTQLLEVFLFTSFGAATQKISVTSKSVYNVDQQLIWTELNCQSKTLQNLVTICGNVIHVGKWSDTKVENTVEVKAGVTMCLTCGKDRMYNVMCNWMESYFEIGCDESHFSVDVKLIHIQMLTLHISRDVEFILLECLNSCSSVSINGKCGSKSQEMPQPSPSSHQNAK